MKIGEVAQPSPRCQVKSSDGKKGLGKEYLSRFADAAKRDRLPNSGAEAEFREKLHLAAAVLAAPFVRQLDLGAAAKSSFRGKSEKRSVQHRLAGNDSFKRLNSVVELREFPSLIKSQLAMALF